MGLVTKAMVAALPLVPKPVVRYFANRYIAGDRLADAVRLVKVFNARGICATLDVLGEEVKTREEAAAAVAAYKEVLAAIAGEGLDANVSLKPTQFGLKLDKAFGRDNVGAVCEEAARLGNFVRIDMEDRTCTSDTLELYFGLKRRFRNVGTVIQAYLRRSLADADRLAEAKANLRLCKGIYVEPRADAYKDKAIVNANYALLLDRLLGAGCYVGIATHDEKMVWEGLRAVHQLKLRRDQYEFQMLLGVDAELRDIIVAAGHRLRVYVPFGTHWYPYSTRRLKENPAMASQTFKNVFKPYHY